MQLYVIQSFFFFAATINAEEVHTVTAQPRRRQLLVLRWNERQLAFVRGEQVMSESTDRGGWAARRQATGFDEHQRTAPDDSRKELLFLILGSLPQKHRTSIIYFSTFDF